MTAETGKAALALLMIGADHGRIAAFLRGGATDFVLNPFPNTSTGAARQTWANQAFEFPILGIEAAGFSYLQRALAVLLPSESLKRHIPRSPAHTCTVFLAHPSQRLYRRGSARQAYRVNDGSVVFADGTEQDFLAFR